MTSQTISTLEYIDLDRVFENILSEDIDSEKDYDFDNNASFYYPIYNKGVTSEELLSFPRAILLSSAGSGKTEELKSLVRKQRAIGKEAFFLRIENLVEDFEESFEIDSENLGSYEQFDDWLSSDQREGYLMLDSVDESRLQDPRAFEKAIKKIGRLLDKKGKLQTSHIIISSRPQAWRGDVDLELCRNYLKDKISEEILENGGYEFFRIADLTVDQVKKFSNEKGMSDIQAFLEAIEKKDATKLVARPLDLSELVFYWKENGKLGSRYELIQNRISLNCVEPNPDTKEQMDLTEEVVIKVVRNIAVLSSHSRNQNIQVPDAALSNGALEISPLLRGLTVRQKKFILGLPIFCAGKYGTVRFNHRSTREFLTAEWVLEMLNIGVPRNKIESLFIREKYGQWVIIPSMRPILEWVVLKDSKLRQRSIVIEPKILLTCPAPELLPLNERAEIISSVCDKHAEDDFEHLNIDRHSIERFSSPELEDLILSLFEKHDNDQVLEFLLSLVRHGNITQLTDYILKYALSSEVALGCRVESALILKEFGNRDGLDQLLSTLKTEETVNIHLLIVVIETLEERHVDTLFHLLEKAKSRTSSDVIPSVIYEVKSYVTKLSLEGKWKFVEQVGKTINKGEPKKRRNEEIVEGKIGLLEIAAEILQELAENRDKRCLKVTSLKTFRKIEFFRDSFGSNAKEKISSLPETVSKFKKLRNALFWFDVNEEREIYSKKRLTEFWYARTYYDIWKFETGDIDYLVKQLSEQNLIDDKLVALSLIASLMERDDERVKKIEEIVTSLPELRVALDSFLTPEISPEDKALALKEKKWKIEQEKRKKKEEKNHLKWQSFLEENLELLEDKQRVQEAFSKGLYHNAQEYIIKQVYSSFSSNWANVRPEDFDQKFSKEVVTSFFNGLIYGWRSFKFLLRSEKEASDNRGYLEILSIIGLSNDIQKGTLISEFNSQEAEYAIRHSLNDLNGLPPYFFNFLKYHSDICVPLIVREFKWELEQPEDTHYLISKFQYGDEAQWKYLSKEAVSLLASPEVCNHKKCMNLLNMLHVDTNISDESISVLVSEKLEANSIHNSHVWYASWIGVDPEIAIRSLESRLVELGKDEAIDLMMRTLVSLVGSMRDKTHVRRNFNTTPVLRDLIILSYKYIKTESDIDRAGGGVYSPGLRDDAQEARSKLFGLLCDLPGREAYEALRELESSSVFVDNTTWIKRSYNKRVHLDAEYESWDAEQLLEFNSSYEFTPQSVEQLFLTAVNKISDLQHDLEEGDNSLSSLIIDKKEEIIRNYCARELRNIANSKYLVSSEDEFADEKRVDLKLNNHNIDSPIPIEIKIADNWSGSNLISFLEEQLIGDYLRDQRSNYGIYLLFYQGKKKGEGDQRVKKYWIIDKKKLYFCDLIQSLQTHWYSVSAKYQNIEEIRVLGVDLTKRKHA